VYELINDKTRGWENLKGDGGREESDGQRIKHTNTGRNEDCRNLKIKTNKLLQQRIM
jgi:hypothetical protein